MLLLLAGVLVRILPGLGALLVSTLTQTEEPVCSERQRP